MIHDYDDEMLYDGTNGQEVVSWCRAKGEFALQMFDGAPTLFLPTGQVRMLPGESVFWSDQYGIVSIIPKMKWFVETDSV